MSAICGGLLAAVLFACVTGLVAGAGVRAARPTVPWWRRLGLPGPCDAAAVAIAAADLRPGQPVIIEHGRAFPVAMRVRSVVPLLRPRGLPTDATLLPPPLLAFRGFK
jgi:hypothetical protein